MSVAEAQQRISSREFAEWVAFHNIEPWHNTQMYLYASQMLAWFANAHRDTKQKPTPFKTEDFLPEFLKPEPTKPDKTRVSKDIFSWLRSWKAQTEKRDRLAQGKRQ